MPSVQVTVRLPNNTTSYETFDAAMARINQHNILQIVRGTFVLAEYPSEAYLSWRYVFPTLQATSRAGELLHPHHENCS